jgi:hypothetical protein
MKRALTAGARREILKETHDRMAPMAMRAMMNATVYSKPSRAFAESIVGHVLPAQGETRK